MQTTIADIAEAVTVRRAQRPPAIGGTTLPIGRQYAWHRAVNRFDAHATIPALTGGTGELTPDQAILLEKARREFAKASRRMHYVKRGGVYRPTIPQRAAGPFSEDPRSRRQQITDAAVDTRLRVVARAHAAELLKLRVAYGIPLHEWADALNRVNGVGVLLEVYAPGAADRLPARVAPRCPPWAPRRYRAAN